MKNIQKRILVTGGCGFIGSCFITKQIKKQHFIVNLDKMTYASNNNNLNEVVNSDNYVFFKGGIENTELTSYILEKYQIDWVVNFAAESHVDNSINNAEIFIKTNIEGTFNLLQSSLQYYRSLSDSKKENFRFLHVSTDEVFGSLLESEPAFTENNRYKPNSPYSASKASSDHLANAWFHTFNLPVIITNCSNNFGANQHSEKLIPTIIRSCLAQKDIPIYGNGKNIRDWIFVGDHCDGIELALIKGKVGESYCFGGENEIRNIDIANLICEILDEVKPRADGISYQTQIRFVQDRMGHDYRYAINNHKSCTELNFSVSKNFSERLRDVLEEVIAKI